MAVFGVASLACGLAQEPWHLVVARFVQGGGAAMASPAALSLITLMYTGAEERAKAFGLWGAIAGLGGTMGLVISGALTGFASWRWIFLINLPVAAIAVVLVPRLVTESRSPRRAHLAHGRRQCPGVVDHDALSPGVGEGDPAVARVLGVAGAPSRAGEVTRAVVKDRHP